MTSIQKRKNKNGSSHWRAIVRIKVYPNVCNHFDRKQEAEDWSAPRMTFGTTSITGKPAWATMP